MISFVMDANNVMVNTVKQNCVTEYLVVFHDPDEAIKWLQKVRDQIDLAIRDST